MYSGPFVLYLDSSSVIAAFMVLVASVITSGAMVYVSNTRSKKETDRIINAAKEAADLLSNVTEKTTERLEAATKAVADAIPPKATREEPLPVEITNEEHKE